MPGVRKYKVAYATGSRADYGIVRRYLKKLQNDAGIDFSVLVTGSHLEDKFGCSVKNIQDDGFRIGLEVPLIIDNSSNAGVIHSMATALDAFGRYFETEKYDLIIVLGDRYEMMAVSIAASMQRIPILHLHGGEATYANYDEFIRHSITKMSLYHFASTEQYRSRVIQLGESPDRVFNMGALGAENCRFITETQVDPAIKRLPEKDYYVVAFHPETLTDSDLLSQVKTVLNAVSKVPEKTFVFMGSNADTGADVIRDTWKGFAFKHSNVYYFENLAYESYLYMLKNSIALVGNSSSGIIEAPSLGICTVNIGHRQDGRISGNSVFHVSCNASEISNAMVRAEEFIRSDTEIYNPYYLPDTAERYYKKTKELLGKKADLCKVFYDVGVKI